MYRAGQGLKSGSDFKCIVQIQFGEEAFGLKGLDLTLCRVKMKRVGEKGCFLLQSVLNNHIFEKVQTHSTPESDDPKFSQTWGHFF